MGLNYILSQSLEKKSIYILLNFLDSPNNTSSYLLYSIVKKSVIKVHSLYPKNVNLKAGNAVIVENKNIVNEIPLEKIPDSLFAHSYVVKILKTSEEGFIKNFDGSDKKKDYYFTSKFCIEFPTIVSKVKFIPGVNIKDSYDEMPFAYFVMPLN